MIDDSGEVVARVFREHERLWAILLVVSWCVVRFVKDPRTWGNVPPKYRPWLAAGVGVAGGAITAAIGKVNILDGAVTGFFAGGGAVLLQSWFIEPVKGSPAAVAGVLSVFLFIGCGPNAPDPARVVGGITQAIYPLDEKLREEFGEDVAACNDDPTCEARERAAWQPARDAMAKVREMWCATKPEDCRE